LCDSDRSDSLLSAACVADPQKRFQVVKCQDCGMAFTNPRPTLQHIGQYYPPGYECHLVARHYSRSWRARTRENLTRCVLRTWYGYSDTPVDLRCRIGAWLGWLWIRRSVHRCQWIPKRGQGKLLDFGCGAGEFLRTMRSRGWSVEGIDSSPRVAGEVTRRTGIRVHVGSLPHPDLPDSSFDVVTMWSSLEHIHDPRGAVRAARRLLRPDGRLIVAVPNFGGWASRLFGENWYGIELPRHLTYFTPDSLHRLLDAEAMHVESIRHVAMDGWNRQSSRLAGENGAKSPLARLLWWKPLALGLSRLGEYTRTADMIVATAKRSS
jgi:SAM-dependent methyltransferase